MNSTRMDITVDKSSYFVMSFVFEDTIGGISIADLSPKFIIREKNMPTSTLLLEGENIEKIGNRVNITIPNNSTINIEETRGYYNFILYNDKVEFRIFEGVVHLSETLRVSK